MSGQKGAEESLVGLPNFQAVYEQVAQALRSFRGGMAPTQTEEEAIPAGSLGITAGLCLRRSLPTLVVGLLTSLGGWILGSAFGLAAGFGGLYEQISRLTPNTHAVELLFPHYYGAAVGSPQLSVVVLVLLSVGMLALTVLAYHWRVLRAA